MAPRNRISNQQIVDPTATAGHVPIYDAYGVLIDSGAAPASGALLVPTSPNDGTQFLSGTNPPTWAVPGGGGGGGFVLLETHSASSSATLDFTSFNNSLYHQYVVMFEDILPVTTGQDLKFRVSTNGGSTYDSSNNYFYCFLYCNNAGSTGNVNGGATGVSAATIFTVINNNSSTGGMSGQLTILNAPGSLRKVFSFQVSATQTGFFTATGSAAWDQTTAINAIRFFFTGNMLSGTIRLYGLAK